MLINILYITYKLYRREVLINLYITVYENIRYYIYIYIYIYNIIYYYDVMVL